NSAWGASPTINSPNDQMLHISNFAVPHRVVGSLNYRIEYANALATTIGVYYNGSHQGRFSYIYGNDINGDGINADLLYLPKNTADVPFVDIVSDGEVIHTVRDQRAALDAFIAETGLGRSRGGSVPRKQCLMPWQTIFDVRLLQNIFTDIGSRRNTLQLSVDVINFGNLLNKEWGVQQNLNRAQNLLSRTSATPASGVPSLVMNRISGEFPITTFQNASNFNTTW